MVVKDREISDIITLRILEKGVGDMAKEDVNLLNYIVVCISEFASRYEMHMRDAYIYLSRNKGIEFLKEFYDVEHTLSFDEVLDDLTAICQKNGGRVN